MSIMLPLMVHGKKEILITQTLIIWLSNNKAIIMQYPLTLYGQKMKRSVHNADVKPCKGDLVTLTSTICFLDCLMDNNVLI